jgi:hypothetical protein
MRKANTLVFNHTAGTIDRHYVNGRVDYDIGTYTGGKGARQTNFNGKFMLVHRMIYADFHGPIAPWMQIDHIHGKQAGNGIANLRWTTASGNSSNQRKAHRDNKSGLLGVSVSNKKWRATITVSGKHINLGEYLTPEAAHEVYLAEKRRLHETCTI